MNEQASVPDNPPVAMILAAGKGTRMRPLTDQCPKPLLPVLGQPLIEWHLQKLKAAGVRRVVINASYLAEHIERYFKHRADDGLVIEVINEGEEPLETAGGIANVLDHLGQDAFILINGDVWIDLDYRVLVDKAQLLSRRISSRAVHSKAEPSATEPSTAISLNTTEQAEPDSSGELLLVHNPVHNPSGDFLVSESGCLQNKPLSSKDESQTYSGISIFHPLLFASLSRSSGALGPFLRQWADQALLQASVYDGYWLDVGTPERLQELERVLSTLSSDPVVPRHG